MPDSTSEIIPYRTDDGRNRISVRLEGGIVWLTQTQIVDLFQVSKPDISMLIRNMFREGELTEPSVDYYPNTDASREFLATIQNKTHWAIHGHTATEAIAERADASQPTMGLTSWPGDTPRRTDAWIAKNCLNKNEIAALTRIATAYLRLWKSTSSRCGKRRRSSNRRRRMRRPLSIFPIYGYGLQANRVEKPCAPEEADAILRLASPPSLCLTCLIPVGLSFSGGN